MPKRRTEIFADFQERLFALMALGDERTVRATYVLGQQKYSSIDEIALPAR
ncbi:hypothetical protein ACWEV3_19880 [Saccharopolyspora sp. NPDC003752]